MQNLIVQIEQWAEDKGILQKATPLSQMDKTFEECQELQEALYFQNNGIESYYNKKGKRVNTQDEIEDGLGDALVTLIIQAKMQSLDIEKCLQGAYDVISKRTGKMVDGQFVKDEK